MEEILREIESTAAANAEVIKRIQAVQVLGVAKGVKYSGRIEGRKEVKAGEEKPTQPRFQRTITLQEIPQTSSFQKHLEEYDGSNEQFIPIDDVFNDHLNYTSKKYDNLVVLNVKIPATSAKYKLFGGGETSATEVGKHLKNLQTIGKCLASIEESANGQLSNETIQRAANVDKILEEVNALLQKLETETQGGFNLRIQKSYSG